MAAVKKTKPLTIDELLDAQRAMLTQTNNLSESQVKYAKEQIKKLEEIQQAQRLQLLAELKDDKDTEFITKPKGDSKHVSLGDVREQLKTLDKTLKENLVNRDGEPVKPDRGALPKFTVVPGSGGGEKSNTEPDTVEQADEERVGRLRKIGNVIEKKTAIQRGGSRNETLNTRNAAAYERFAGESKNREKFLADATEEQNRIFSQLEKVMIQLREAGSEDSERLRQEIAHMTGQIEQSPDNKAKSAMKPMLENIQRDAAGGRRGDQGTLGDAFAALTGKKTVLKEGTMRDSRTGRVHDINPDGSQGKMTKGGEKAAAMGRLSGAGRILGNWILEKNEKSIEGMRHEGTQKFLDNFRPSSTDGGTRLEQLSNLQGQQDALMGNEPTATKKPILELINGGKGKASAEAKPGGMPTKVDKLSVTANVVNIRSGSVKLGGSASGSAGGGTSGGTSGTGGGGGTGFGGLFSGRTAKEDRAKEGIAAEPKGGATDNGPGIGDLAGLAGGGSIMSKAGTFARGAASYALPAAVMYGAGRAVDYGIGKLGVGKDDKGNDLQLDSKADDANWNRMSWFEKAQSGVARGIEKVGGLVAPNMANQAAADRIKTESAYFAKQDGATAQPATPAAGKDALNIAPKKSGPGPNWQAALKDYESGTPADHLERGMPGIGAKFRELAKSSEPVSDDFQSIEVHEQMLVTKAQGALHDKAQKAQEPGLVDSALKLLPKRASGGPVVEGKSYLVGERGPEIMTPQKSGKITPNNQLKDLTGQDLKDFQKYSQTRAQIESAEYLSGGGDNTFADVDPALKIKRDKIMRDNYEYGEKLKARGIDVEGHYNRPEPGDVSAKQSSVDAINARDHAPTLNNLSAATDMRGNRNAQPIVVNNNTTNNTGGKGDMPMVKGTSRNEESSLSRYTNRTASFF